MDNLQSLIVPLIFMAVFLVVFVTIFVLMASKILKKVSPALSLATKMTKMFGGQGKNEDERKRILATGAEATAEVLEIIDKGLTLNNMYFAVTMRVRVEPSSGQSYEAMLDAMIQRTAIPRPGDKLRVKVDPQDKMKMAIVS